MEKQGGSVNAGGRKERIANGNEQQVTQAVQDAIENMVGKAALTKDGEHDEANLWSQDYRHLPGAFIWPQACFLPHFFPGRAE